MRRAVVAVAGLLAAAALGLGGYLMFTRAETSGLAKQAEQTCTGRDQPSPGTAADLPLALPRHQGATVLRIARQGRTVIALSKIAGGRADVVATRDAMVKDLTAVGYTVVKADQKPTYSARAELGGTHRGTLTVTPLCVGLLQIRYQIDQ